MVSRGSRTFVVGLALGLALGLAPGLNPGSPGNVGIASAVAGPALIEEPELRATVAVGLAATTTRLIAPTLFGIHPGLNPTSPTRAVATSWRLWDSNTMWPTLQPTRSGAFDWSSLDALVARARAQGVTDFVIPLGLTPRWAAGDSAPAGPYGPSSSTAPPLSDDDFRAYVTALAHHVTEFTGTTWAFEAWNEADLTTFFTGTPAQAARLTAIADEAAKTVNPGITIVSASVTTRRGIKPDGFFPLYLRALAAEHGFGGRPWPTDVFALHPYPSGTAGPTAASAGVALFKKVLARENAPARPLWNTEFNFGVAGPGTIPHTSFAGVAAQYMARAFLDSMRLGVSRVYPYNWAPAGNYLGVALFTDTPATKALTTLKGWLSGVRLIGCTGTELYTCHFSRGRTTFRVLWRDSSSSLVRLTRATRVCPASGGTCIVTIRPLRVGAMPVRLS
ncbi:MAG: hypothetical protein F2842_04715 [Actinobacteria bacterium]|uniref:Unannotated protein n=1 Tax=freshwater metagenome TaxID=449393 RepID=A0A6J7JIL2_9ZZZZ|nr:hypothetical protein [Actinomycetota bacterium]